jgi:hypothetical protein
MDKYLKKYAITYLLLVVLLVVLNLLFITVFPLMHEFLGIEKGDAFKTGVAIADNMPLLTHIILAIIIARDFTKLKIKGLAVVLLTIFFSFGGIILALLLINNKTKEHAK